MKFLFKATYDDDLKLMKHAGYWRSTVFWIILAAALPLLFMALGAKQTALSHPIQILTFATCAMGLMILTGYTGLVSLGHGAFFALGAYTFHFLIAVEGARGGDGWGLPWYLALALTPLILGALGYLLARPTLRMSAITLAIATLLFMIFVEQALKQWGFMGGGNGFRVPKLVENGNWFFELVEWGKSWGADAAAYDPDNRGQVARLERSVSKYATYYGALLALLVTIWLMRNMERTRLGRTLIAIRDSEVSARSMGINVTHYKSLAFALSSALAGLAGVFYSYNIGSTFAPESINFITSIILLLIVVVGGLGSVHGAIFGAVTYVFLREMAFPELADLFEHWAAASAADGGGIAGALAWFFNIGGLGDIMFAALLLLILFFEPLGLYARWKKTEAFFQTFPFYRAGTFKQQRTYAKTERLK